MKISTAVFIQSNQDVRKCPPPVIPEFAFIGRSNVGKSSLINMLTNQRNLARISGTPGKTKLINHFLINDSWYLVDLPGFGYARASKSVVQSLGKLITVYLLTRPNLLNTFLLIDSRLEPQEIDQKFMEWLAVNRIPFCILFTKSDKLGHHELIRNLYLYKEHMLKTWEDLPPSIVTSAKTRLGKERVLEVIEETSKIFDPRWIDFRNPDAVL